MAVSPGREQGRKRSRESEVLEFLKEDGHREREAMARQEERERPAEDRAEISQKIDNLRNYLRH